MDKIVISNSSNVNFDKSDPFGNMKLDGGDNNKIIIDEINKGSLYHKNANTSIKVPKNVKKKKKGNNNNNNKEQKVLNRDFNNDNAKDVENNIRNSQCDKEGEINKNEINPNKNNNDVKSKTPLNKKNSNYSEEKKKQTSLLNNNKNNSKLVKLKSENDNIDLKKSESFKYKTSLKANCSNNVKSKINNGNIENNYYNVDDTTDKKKMHLNDQVNTHNKKSNKGLSSPSISKLDDVEINKEDILFQYEKCISRKRKERKKIKMKSKLFRKSVKYSKYYGGDILNVVNQLKLNLRFYQREMDDFLSVIWNLQNM
ncbi:STARP antigen [Plasmodium yoelii yoelii]|nr:STARP antigen [Plasmodium yoelii yoelii]